MAIELITEFESLTTLNPCLEFESLTTLSPCFINLDNTQSYPINPI